ncbi:MAG: hypothetical protein B7Y45_01780 [Sphingomonas sp. 28-66-16]|nr:MAG: hypothetical protein B7Y45_01780 [Sphingomonas sp. 28-66-16]
MFSVQQSFDRALFRPAALGYRKLFPKALRTILRHGLSNLTEPFVFLNDLLQLRPKRAAKTLARFVINSSIGIGGLLDVAKAAKLPHRNNGFGNTLAHYGVGPGPYLFLPLIGPTTLRDFIADQSENFVPPIVIGRPLYPFYKIEYQAPRLVIGGLDLRAESDEELTTIMASAVDPYATLRSVYLQNRAAEIAENEGKKASPAFDDPLVDPEAAAPGATAPVAAPEPAPAPADVPSTVPPPQEAPALDSGSNGLPTDAQIAAFVTSQGVF